MSITPRFDLLNALASAFRGRGLEASVGPDSICVGVARWDRSSQQVLVMRSAAPVVSHGLRTFHVFAVEQYSQVDTLTKYSVTVCDDAKKQLKAWHLDTKRGPHLHEFVDGQKVARHIPHTDSVDEVADHIVEFIRTYKSGSR